MSSLPPRLALHAVSRRRAGRMVLKPTTLHLAAGEVLGLLGVNGAGKTTTLMLMAGVLAPSNGRVELNGADLGEVPQCARRHIGYLPEHAPLWPELTVREQLDAHGALRGLRGAALSAPRDTLLLRLDLAPLARRLCAQLSLGQRQRVGLACALLHQPDVLILDEPGTGLDPVQTENLRTLLRERAAAGAAIVLSTHLLAEVTALCTRVAILHQGALRHDAPLHTGAAAWRVTLGVNQAEPARAALSALAAAIELEDAQHVRVQLHRDADAALLARTLVGANLALLGLEPATPPLARVFMDIAASGSERAA